MLCVSADGSFGAPPGPGGYYDAPPMGGAAGGYGPPGKSLG